MGLKWRIVLKTMFKSVASRLDVQDGGITDWQLCFKLNLKHNSQKTSTQIKSINPNATHGHSNIKQ